MRCNPTYIKGLLVILSSPVAASAALLELDARKVTRVEGLEHGHGVPVDLDLLRVDGGDFGNVVQSPFPLLLLKLERDAPHGSALDALHQVGGESGDLVPKALGLDDGDVVAQPLVDVEVKSHPVVVLLDDRTARTLHRLCSNTSHGCFSFLCSAKLRSAMMMVSPC